MPQQLGNTKKGDNTGQHHRVRAQGQAEQWGISDTSLQESAPMLPLLSEIVPVELVPLKVAPPILKAVARRITVCDREFSVERFTARHSIVITDVKTQQQVECADVLSS